jgi:hypothetical protein
MIKSEQIRQRLKEMASQHGPLQTVLAEVVSVNEPEGTCDLQDEDGLEFFDVRLKPVLTVNESLVMIPAVGSMVLIQRIEDDEEWLLTACEQVDKWRLTSADCVLEMDATGIEVSKNGVSLKNILSSLVTEVIAIYAPKNVANLTQIKMDIQNLLK